MLAFISSVMRGLARNVQVYNPTPNSLDVRWDPAPGPVLQYRVVYSPVDGTRPSESVSNFVMETAFPDECSHMFVSCLITWENTNHKHVGV